jgi:hypothetical protein
MTWTVYMEGKIIGTCPSRPSAKSYAKRNAVEVEKHFSIEDQYGKRYVSVMSRHSRADWIEDAGQRS